MSIIDSLSSQIMSHRVAGRSVADISALVDRPHKFVRLTLQRLTSLSMSDHRKEVLLATENARLDALTRAHWEDAISSERLTADYNGEEVSVKSSSAIDSAKLILAISKQRATLNGIAAPVETNATLTVNVSLIEALRTNQKVIENTPVLDVPVADSIEQVMITRDEAKERYAYDRPRQDGNDGNDDQSATDS